jgi:hypothetical protein
VPLITLPVLALAAMPGTAQASAPAATISIQSQAQLLADGHVVMTVSYSCTPASGGTAGSVNVEVQQPGRFGSASGNATCDDQRHTMNFDVAPGPFTPGSATAFGFVSSSGASATTTAEMKVS